MKTSEMTVTVLEPAEGEFLTQTNLEEGAERTFSTKVFLAQGASESDWRSAAAAEKEAYEAERTQELHHLQ